PLLKKASEQDPENMRLHMDLGYAYQAQRQYDEAGKEFELVARQPGEFQEQAKGAIKTLRDSEETVRAAADARQGALVQQAYAALSAGNKPLARKRFVLVLSNDPRNKTALKQLGFLDLEEGKLRGAAQNFETVRSLDPQDYFAALQLGYVYQRLKDGDKAREAFTAALGSSDEKIHSAAQSALGPVAGPEQASRGPETLEAPQVPPTR
ncbi:MAG TPA: tetratricopeptide repeat protein, partial [Elusimicrobiota bacterium]|nr:tetratricopeptide repeat protein [Elusimicrobiota bacterium]